MLSVASHQFKTWFTGLRETAFVHIQTLDYVDDGISPGDVMIRESNTQKLVHRDEEPNSNMRCRHHLKVFSSVILLAESPEK